MGYFNLDKTEKPDGVPCTVYRLCKELESENQESKGYSYNALLKKFHDKSGSGIGLEQVRKRLELIYPNAYEWIQKLSDDKKEYLSVITIKLTH